MQFVDPVVRPQYPSYRTVTGSLRIYVGFEQQDTENEDNWSLRHWTLKDKDNVVIRSGDVNAKDNTFESFVDLSGLLSNTIYSFTVNNEEFKQMTATIITIVDMSLVSVIDEKATFNEPIAIHGDLIYPDVSEKPRHIRFPYDWDVTRTLGNGIIRGKTSGKWFVYAPSRIYTRHRGISSIAYTPFVGKPEVVIPVFQLVDIRRVGEYKYSVSPPSRIEVAFTYGFPSITRTYTSQSAVSSLNLREVDLSVSGVVKVAIAVIY